MTDTLQISSPVRIFECHGSNRMGHESDRHSLITEKSMALVEKRARSPTGDSGALIEVKKPRGGQLMTMGPERTSGMAAPIMMLQGHGGEVPGTPQSPLLHAHKSPPLPCAPRDCSCLCCTRSSPQPFREGVAFRSLLPSVPAQKNTCTNTDHAYIPARRKQSSRASWNRASDEGSRKGVHVNMLSSEKPGAACRNRSHTLEGPDFLCKKVDLGNRGEGRGRGGIPRVGG